MAAELRRPKLPACKECSVKKIKCDSNRPRCRWCARSNLDCVILDSVNKEWVSRSYIDELERQEAAASTKSARKSEPANGAVAGSHETPASQALSIPSAAHGSSIAARGGGFNFIALLFSDAEWRRSNADLLRTLATAHSGPHTMIEACPLPSCEVAQGLFEKYLDWSHILTPFLLRREVWALHQRVFSAPPADSDSVESHDLFQAFIICAIGSVVPYRKGTHAQHPEAYYRAALQQLDARFLTRGLKSIQGLLLICRFGVFHHIGVSIWDIARLCIRLCTEQGLHCGDGEGEDALRNQERRRVFWQVYQMERYSSTTLDRPFAIDDKDIHVGFPADKNDDELDSPETVRNPNELSETTVLLFSVRLRRISSRIHTELSRLRQETEVYTQPHLAVGQIYTTLNSLLQELQAWRTTAPVVQHPRCLYETQEWFDSLHSREKMALVRRTVDLIPKINGTPPGHVLNLFLQTALETIDRYATLFRRKSAIYTRSYFHTLFTAGLSVVYCTSVAPNQNPGDFGEVSQGLALCQDALASMAEHLPDFSSYVTVFEALCHQTTRTAQQRAGHTAENTDHTRPVAVPTPGALRPEPPAAMYQLGALSSDPYLNRTPAHDWTQAHQVEFPVQPHAIGAPPTDDLLQWAFANDESIWNMDMMLGEYVYGESSKTHLFDGMDF